MSKKILVTGAAGFVGSFLSKALLEKGDYEIIGIDNLNNYYDVSLKEARLEMLSKFSAFSFVKGDISDKSFVEELFNGNEFDVVVHLAAQAGVRYSIDNPDAYINSNLIGTYNILEAVRHHPVKHLVFASSSSVYGSNKKVPYSTEDKTDHPVSLYAATKKANELIAYSYAKLYGIPCTGLRFFTVYGPMGRPDMAYFKFANKIVKGEKIQIYNNGDMYRDFTYVDDIVNGIMKVMNKVPEKDENGVQFKVYNIGNNSPVSLLKFVEILEQCLIKENVIKGPADKEFLPMQPGDVYQTYADVNELIKDFNWKPETSLEEGLARFAKWYKEFYK